MSEDLPHREAEPAPKDPAKDIYDALAARLEAVDAQLQKDGTFVRVDGGEQYGEVTLSDYMNAGFEAPADVEATDVFDIKTYQTGLEYVVFQKAAIPPRSIAGSALLAAIPNLENEAYCIVRSTVDQSPELVEDPTADPDLQALLGKLNIHL